MRRLLAASALVAAATVTTSSQVFRGGVDVITVDITVLDKDGRPVDDLKAGAASRQAVLPPERFFSTNSAPVPAAR